MKTFVKPGYIIKTIMSKLKFSIFKIAAAGVFMGSVVLHAQTSVIEKIRKNPKAPFPMQSFL